MCRPPHAAPYGPRMPQPSRSTYETAGDAGSKGNLLFGGHWGVSAPGHAKKSIGEHGRAAHYQEEAPGSIPIHRRPPPHTPCAPPCAERVCGLQEPFHYILPDGASAPPGNKKGSGPCKSLACCTILRSVSPRPPAAPSAARHRPADAPPRPAVASGSKPSSGPPWSKTNNVEPKTCRLRPESCACPTARYPRRQAIEEKHALGRSCTSLASRHLHQIGKTKKLPCTLLAARRPLCGRKGKHVVRRCVWGGGADLQGSEPLSAGAAARVCTRPASAKIGDGGTNALIQI